MFPPPLGFLKFFCVLPLGPRITPLPYPDCCAPCRIWSCCSAVSVAHPAQNKAPAAKSKKQIFVVVVLIRTFLFFNVRSSLHFRSALPHRTLRKEIKKVPTKGTFRDKPGLPQIASAHGKAFPSTSFRTSP